MPVKVLSYCAGAGVQVSVSPTKFAPLGRNEAEYVMSSPLGSVAEIEKLSVPPLATLRDPTGSSTGGSFAPVTVIVTISESMSGVG
jgi:hypothetical protein